MYPLRPPTVHVFDTALADTRSARRVETMLGALRMGLDSAHRVTESDIPPMIADNGWERARLRQGEHEEHTDPALVFGTICLDGTPDVSSLMPLCTEGTPSSLVANLLGRGGQTLHNEAAESGRVCRSRHQFETLYGCPHWCKYCRAGKVAVVFTNLEEFVERQVIPTAEQNPWQKVFMYNSALGDTICFEPEYGLSKLLAEYYATTADQHYLIHTKSANVDFLLDLDHQGHTIVLWSLSGETASRVVEPGSATTEERIEAARKCQQAGYPVRFKLKPITPVRAWREECRAMIEGLFASVQPESIGLCCIAWMPLSGLAECIDLDLLDPAYVAEMAEHAEAMRGVVTGPLPHHVRAEIYRFYLDEIRKRDRDVPVYLCTESREMWDEFAPLMGMHAGNYACGCGPQSPPKTRTIERLIAPVGCPQP